MSFYESRAAIKIKQATIAMNHIPNASDLSKGMAHYWFELDEKNNNYFLFCQTSDQRIFHATKPQLMEFIGSSEEKNARLLLRPWDSIGVNGQKRTRTGKPKGEEEEEQKGLPKKKKQKAVVLLAPSDPILPELPFEILTMVLDGMAKPKAPVRRFIFDSLKGSTPNLVSFHLSNSRTVWKWYREILHRKPPAGLAQLEIYYKQRGDLNGFARRWYSGFVRLYDIEELTWLWRYYDVKQNRKKMKKKFNPTTMYMIMTHLRGKTIGFEKHIQDGTNYETVEMEIQKALDSLPDMPFNHHLPKIIMRPLKIAMADVIQSHDGEKDIRQRWLRQLFWRHPDTKLEDKDWFIRVWDPSETRRLVKGIIQRTMELCEDAIVTIRGIGPDRKFSTKDLTAYVWLNQVIMRLFYFPLRKAMESEMFGGGFIIDLREEVRLRTRSKQEQIAEDKLSAEAQEHIWRKRMGKYYEVRQDTQEAWKKKWRRPKKPKQKGKEKVEEEESEEEESDYDDDEEGHFSENEYNQLMGITNKLNGQIIQFWN